MHMHIILYNTTYIYSHNRSGIRIETGVFCGQVHVCIYLSLHETLYQFALPHKHVRACIASVWCLPACHAKKSRHICKHLIKY